MLSHICMLKEREEGNFAMFLLDDLLIGLPAKGLVSLFEKIYEMAQDEFTDETKIKEDLLLLQAQFEMEQISEREYELKEEALLERLMLAREAKALDQRSYEPAPILQEAGAK